MTPTSPDATPTEGNEPPQFDWAALVPLFVHPTRVAIIEAMSYLGQPLSATDLNRLFDGELDLSTVSYHVVQLAGVEVIVKVSQRRRRGSVETFYCFP